MTMVRSFTYLLVPPVFWVITTYGKFMSIVHLEFSDPFAGIYIGLGALTFNYTFPIKIVAPPYNWSQTNSGLIAVGEAVGYFLAIPFTTISDRLAAYRTKRNGGIREAEMRLGALIPFMLIAPAGLVVYGLTAQRNLHWFGYFAGVAMCNFSAYFYFTFTLAYAVDSYTANMSEMLIIMNIGKQAISFGMSLKLLDWILSLGYAKIIAGVFCGILLANNLAVLPFMLLGKRMRSFISKTWLAGMHKKTQTAGQTL